MRSDYPTRIMQGTRPAMWEQEAPVIVVAKGRLHSERL